MAVVYLRQHGIFDPPMQGDKYIYVTLRGQIKETTCTLRKQDPALAENCATPLRLLSNAVIKPK